MSNINKAAVTEDGYATPRIKTKLKFIRSEISGAPVSFVSQNPITGRVCGVRQDSIYPKKVCVVDKSLASEIVLNALYDCTLIPMSEKNGYVVIEAEPAQFKAKIVSKYIKGNVYTVAVKFGNKTIRFDPFNGRKDSVRDLKTCKSLLEKRIDVQNIVQVIDDFTRAAIDIVRFMEHDGFFKRAL